MDKIYNAIQGVGNLFNHLVNVIVSGFGFIVDFFSAVYSIISTLWYGLKTIIPAVYDLLKQVLQGSVFGYLNTGFEQLSSYIGGPATIFIATLLFVVFVRIGIAFVFKIVRLNLDYKKYKSVKL